MFSVDSAVWGISMSLDECNLRLQTYVSRGTSSYIIQPSVGLDNDSVLRMRFTTVGRSGLAGGREDYS
jgi:hypothetical protein